MSQDINVLALVKGAERYVFLYDDASRAETLRTLGRYASNPELSFTWYDAAVLEPEDPPGEPEVLAARAFRRAAGDRRTRIFDTVGCDRKMGDRKIEGRGH